ncbi:flagellar biosynthetic protein FliO [Curvivirga sp.]|uniref:flagellar biosynthetic protein FliO n=1 Tax=Curvivirga sp. TaxID=2856848 RepID=UPI003B5B750B
MESVIGYADFLRMIVALIFVLSLILLALFLGRKYGKGWGFQHTPLTKRRLQIIESLPIGPKQRMMIVRRDNMEHVLVIGQETAVLIEKNISITAFDSSPEPKSPDDKALGK